MLADLIIKNSDTLIKFDQLFKNGQNPVLAVYYGREFVIIEYQASGCIEKVKNFTNKIFYFFLSGFGLIDKSSKGLEALFASMGKECDERLAVNNQVKEDFYKGLEGLDHGTREECLSRMTPDERIGVRSWQLKKSSEAREVLETTRRELGQRIQQMGARAQRDLDRNAPEVNRQMAQMIGEQDGSTGGV